MLAEHPGAVELIDWARRGRLSEQARRVTEHLAACAECRAVVETIVLLRSARSLPIASELASPVQPEVGAGCRTGTEAH